MAEEHQDLSKVLGRHGGIYLPRNRQKLSVGSRKPPGKFSRQFGCQISESVLSLIVVVDFLSSTFPFPNLSQILQASVLAVEFPPLLPVLSVTNGLISIPENRFHNTLLLEPCEPYRSSVLKERRVNMINRTPLAKTGCSLLNMKHFAFPDKQKVTYIH